MSKVPSPYYNNDPHSFGFQTCRDRWPNILNKVIRDTKNEIHNSNKDTKINQGKEIVKQVENLIKSILDNKTLQPFKENIPGLESYNNTLKELGEITWLTGPWLFCECYLYRRLDAFYKMQNEWVTFDPFEEQKRSAYKSSDLGVNDLTIRYKKLHAHFSDPNAEKWSNDILFTIFSELVCVALWGNSVDLSLLTNATLEDIQSHQGSEAIDKASKNIICNDLKKAWDGLLANTKAHKRIDFVLDNAGFEFFTDTVLALFLLDSKIVNEVVFHCKTRPWMVSDTMYKDYDIFLKDSLSSFPVCQNQMKTLISQLENYKQQGKFRLTTSDFWTIDLDYWHICPSETQFGGSDLWKYFQNSALVIFKGDLNYRKLTSDRKWARDTPFYIAINSLATSGIPILALRVCKADVCSGLQSGKDEELSRYWEGQGHKYGELWASSGKWAVISYCNGHKAI